MDDININSLGLEGQLFFAAKTTNRGVETVGIPHLVRGQKLPPAQPNGLHDGVFMEWNWDGQRLVVQNDRYGMSPLFYSCYANDIWISPSIYPVLEGNAPKGLDYAALSVLLRMGHLIGNDTPFEYIKVLPPNSTLTWEQGQISIESGNLPISQRIDKNLSFDDAVDQFSLLFDRAVQKRLPKDDDFIVPLSGGRDSRHILFALDAHGKKPKTCVTLQYRPPATNEDARVAELIADEMGIPHVVIEKAPSWFHAVLKDVHLTNLCGGSHAWVLPLAAWLTNRTNTTYDGLAGSVLSGGFLTDEKKVQLYNENCLEELASILLSEGGKEGFNQTVLNRDFYQKISLSIAIQRMVEELKRHVNMINPMLSFIFWNRTRRGISQIPFSILSHIPVVHCPYLDHDLYDFVTGLDASFFLGNKLHDEAITRTYPKYAHLPFEDKSKKASYQKNDYVYFRDSLKNLLIYLMQQGFHSSKLVRKGYLYPKILFDLTKPNCQLPWYLISTVYCLEFEKLYNN
jgi:hypothetical protein